MAIKIKRSTGDLAPASLAAGQLAYSEGPNNGGTLYYGEIGGTVREIGGRKFVDKLNGIEAGAQVNDVTSVFGRTGAVTLQSSDVTGALGYTPINPNEKGANNGIATLDAGGKVPSTQLPSYVDDVEEAANLAAFPATGETGKIYVALDTGKTYRWSGSVYVEISASPGSTDSVTEGSTNLYYTDARARAAISVTDAGGDGSLSYNNSTGVLTYTGPSASEVRAHFSAGTGISITDGVVASTITQYADTNARSAISVTDAGGDGSLSYNNTTGVLTYTGPSAAEVRAHFSGGTGITITDGVVATTITQYTDSLARSAISVTDAGGDGSMSYNSSTGVITYTGPSASEVRAHFSAGTGISITNGVIAATGTGGITDVVQDTTPQLGGNLDVQTHTITTSVTNGNIELNPNGIGAVKFNNGNGIVYINGATLQDDITNPTTGIQLSTGQVSIATDGDYAGATFGITGALNDPGSSTANIDAGSVNVGQSAATSLYLGSGSLTTLNIAGLAYPVADGTAGQVLTTNGTGTVSWATPFSGDYDDLSNKPTLVTAFTGLSDVPSSYTGQAGKYVKVNATADGLEFNSDVDDGTF